jgi:hypothetical protein
VSLTCDPKANGYTRIYPGKYKLLDKLLRGLAHIPKGQFTLGFAAAIGAYLTRAASGKKENREEIKLPQKITVNGQPIPHKYHKYNFIQIFKRSQSL